MHTSPKYRNRQLPEWSEMQGLVLSAYPHLDQAAFQLFRIDDPVGARLWLKTLLPSITYALRDPAAHSSRNVNVAFTADGLRKLSVDTTAFSAPFAEGIDGSDHRSRLLGDLGASRPARWNWGAAHQAVDVLVALYVDARSSLAAEIVNIGPPAGAMSLVVPPIEARRLSDAKGREHFGFADGISQPILQGSTDAQRFPESPHVTALGEFVFGYRDEHGATSGPADGAAAFARNGTYLVARQIEQHVGEFHAFCERATLSNGAPDPEAASRLEAKIIGRLPDGTPLVPNGDRRDNDFGFAEDPFGYGCPVGAHVRRANPRGSLGNQNVPHEPDNAHRILRRARSYGSSYHPGVLDSGRGLLFLALNADIERQFEFIQQNWINSPSFNGIDGERDPLVGGDVVPHQTFTIPGVPAPCRIHNVPRFVNVVGGQYFFLPGKQALLSLAGGS